MRGSFFLLRTFGNSPHLLFGVMKLWAFFCDRARRAREFYSRGAASLAYISWTFARRDYISWKNVYLHEFLQKKTPFSCILNVSRMFHGTFHLPKEIVIFLKVEISTFSCNGFLLHFLLQGANPIIWYFLRTNRLKIRNFSCKYTFCHLSPMCASSRRQACL